MTASRPKIENDDEDAAEHSGYISMDKKVIVQHR